MMKGRSAGLLFLAVCVVLATLRLLGELSSTASGAIFAVALVVLGVLSGGFRKRGDREVP